jgi:hypothetical protein
MTPMTTRWRARLRRDRWEAVVFEAVGAKRVVLGAAGNPTPADGLQMSVAALEAAGTTRDQIRALGRETPAALLMG